MRTHGAMPDYKRVGENGRSSRLHRDIYSFTTAFGITECTRNATYEIRKLTDIDATSRDNTKYKHSIRSHTGPSTAYGWHNVRAVENPRQPLP